MQRPVSDDWQWIARYVASVGHGLTDFHHVRCRTYNDMRVSCHQRIHHTSIVIYITAIKVVIVTYSPNRSCVPILKLLASTIAERSRGPKFFQCFLAQTPASFCPKSCYSASYSTSPTCIVNLKLLASTVAEINRGSQIFWMLP